MPVFKAKYNLSKGKILTSNDYEQTEVDLDNLPSKVLQDLSVGAISTKRNIRKGNILTQNDFTRRLLIPKNSYVLAILRDGGLVLQFEAKALSGGNIGETIRIKTEEGKLFNAIIVSENKVVIN